jgi:putative FmdB family regulatory protein
MAVYEYKCPNEHIYTEVRPMTTNQIVVKCPKCGEILSRMFDSTPVLFKGKGFYSTGG